MGSQIADGENELARAPFGLQRVKSGDCERGRSKKKRASDEMSNTLRSTFLFLDQTFLKWKFCPIKEDFFVLATSIFCLPSQYSLAIEYRLLPLVFFEKGLFEDGRRRNSWGSFVPSFVPSSLLSSFYLFPASTCPRFPRKRGEVIGETEG